MSDPYLINEPALISFSGGRTSGYLLKHIIDAHGGTLPDHIKVAFANTGKEHEATLDFVRDCSTHWGVEIAWLEYATQAPHRTIIVDHATASRDGEPFDAVIRQERMLPNPIARLCTKNLKIKRLEAYARHWLGWKKWASVVGLRADEKRADREVPGRIVPLKHAGAVKADVLQWWNSQPFDLNLAVDEDGETEWGNCDLCFLFGRKKLEARLKLDPSRADWWVNQEDNAPGLRIMRDPSKAMFRSDRPSYRTMQAAVMAGQPIPKGGWNAERDCACTD
ncbi:MAG: hypothetical protein BGO05_10165 [Rhizobiales bacterium 63-7]|nr:Nin-like protein [Hyphomicrobiales bacterium]OJU66202.1 MAG: hypothetical protein BGO05_10165 [Rhizobiales bacterium 63-7]